MSENATRGSSRTDWARVDAMTDEDIDFSDNPPATEEELARAQLRMPASRTSVTLELDTDVLAWYQTRGESFQKRINSILRAHMTSQESRAAA